LRFPYNDLSAEPDLSRLLEFQSGALHGLTRDQCPLLWPVIGIYTGREDNVFWRRLPDSKGKVEAAGARALCVGDAEPLGHNIIHSVTNPIPRLTGAIHVYGGDFFAVERSEWDPESLQEGRYDIAKNMKLFEDANALTKHYAEKRN
jgi:predicted metal-dependent enzyme (double-stranded beta helix superfamily)